MFIFLESSFYKNLLELITSNRTKDEMIQNISKYCEL